MILRRVILPMISMLMLSPAFAAPAKAARAKGPGPKTPARGPTAATATAQPVDAVGAMKRALASTGGAKAPTDPTKLDPNAALEVRGQSRTLSMMLVLKNGKEAINFIKVRQDYRPEINSTPY